MGKKSPVMQSLKVNHVTVLKRQNWPQRHGGTGDYLLSIFDTLIYHTFSYLSRLNK